MVLTVITLWGAVSRNHSNDDGEVLLSVILVERSSQLFKTRIHDILVGGSA